MSRRTNSTERRSSRSRITRFRQSEGPPSAFGSPRAQNTGSQVGFLGFPVAASPPARSGSRAQGPFADPPSAFGSPRAQNTGSRVGFLGFPVAASPPARSGSRAQRSANSIFGSSRRRANRGPSSLFGQPRQPQVVGSVTIEPPEAVAVNASAHDSIPLNLGATPEEALDRRKKAKLRKQDRERSELPIVPDGRYDLGRKQSIETPAAAKEHYKDLLGENYEDIEFYDAISMENVKIGPHLREDKDNIIFVVYTIGRDEPSYYASSKNQLSNTMALYDCDQFRSGKDKDPVIGPSFDDEPEDKFIGLNTLGVPGGVANYHAVKAALGIGSKNVNQVVVLRQTEYKTGPMISHEVRHLGDSMVSAFHCQEGTEQTYYATWVHGLPPVGSKAMWDQQSENPYLGGPTYKFLKQTRRI